MSSVPEFSPDRFQSLLRQEVEAVVSEQLAVAGVDIGPEQFPLPGSLDDNIQRVGAWAQAVSPVLSGPITFETMEATGQAGVILLDQESLESILAGAKGDDSYRPGPLWMEAQPLGDDWVAYPQDDSLDLRLLLWLPIALRDEVARLATVEIPLPLTTAAQVQPMAVIKGSGCAPVFDRSGGQKRWVCDDAGCSHPCTERWQSRRGVRRLFACRC